MKGLLLKPSILLAVGCGFLLHAAVVLRAGAQATPGQAEHMSIPVKPPRLPAETPMQPIPRADPSKSKIWSAVILASNAAKPAAPPAELRALAPRLQRVFGYNQFEIVGRDEAPLEDGAERKLTPSKSFWIDLKARQASVKEARGGYLLSLRLYQDEKPLVDSVTLIAPDSPLFFRGPLHARGQIIVVLQVRP